MDPGELLDFVTKALERLGLPYFVTGSTATIAYGEPRFTNDIDIVIEIEPRTIDSFVAEFEHQDFYLSPESIALAIRNRTSFNLIHPSSGLKVDFMVAEGSAFNESRFRRVRAIDTGTGRSTAFASPEDVILKKLEYYRDGGSEKHLRDIAGVLRTSENLDFSYLDDWARQLNVVEQWQEAKSLG